MGNCAYKSNCVWNINCSQTSYMTMLIFWSEAVGDEIFIDLRRSLPPPGNFQLISFIVIWIISISQPRYQMCSGIYGLWNADQNLSPTLRWWVLVRPVARLRNQRSTVLSTHRQLLATGFCASHGKAAYYMADIFEQRPFPSTQVYSVI